MRPAPRSANTHGQGQVPRAESRRPLARAHSGSKRPKLASRKPCELDWRGSAEPRESRELAHLPFGSSIVTHEKTRSGRSPAASSASTAPYDWPTTWAPPSSSSSSAAPRMSVGRRAPAEPRRSPQMTRYSLACARLLCKGLYSPPEGSRARRRRGGALADAVEVNVRQLAGVREPPGPEPGLARRAHLIVKTISAIAASG